MPDIIMSNQGSKITDAARESIDWKVVMGGITSKGGTVGNCTSAVSVASIFFGQKTKVVNFCEPLEECKIMDQ